MKTEWILLANSTHARLLQREDDSPLVALRAWEHEQGRLHTSELGDARPGHHASDRNFGGARLEPRSDAHRKEALHFAKELADELEAGAQAARFSSLSVYASSPFLGELKAALGSAAQARLAGTHDVDFTSFGLSEVEDRIALAARQ